MGTRKPVAQTKQTMRCRRLTVAQLVSSTGWPRLRGGRLSLQKPGSGVASAAGRPTQPAQAAPPPPVDAKPEAGTRMDAEWWLRVLRVFLGVVVAPAVVPLVLYASLGLALARLAPSQVDLTANGLYLFVLAVGVGPAYLCMLCLGLPYIVLLRRAAQLNFRTAMLPPVILSWVYAVLVYTLLRSDYDYAFAGAVAGLCAFGVLLAGLLFYFIALWRVPPQEDHISLLLADYAVIPKPAAEESEASEEKLESDVSTLKGPAENPAPTA